MKYEVIVSYLSCWWSTIAGQCLFFTFDITLLLGFGLLYSSSGQKPIFLVQTFITFHTCEISPYFILTIIKYISIYEFVFHLLSSSGVLAAKNAAF